MDRVVLIIQARMGSVRLPGKSMMPLCGKPLIGHILERVSRCNRVDEIVLATSALAENDAIAACAKENGVSVFRGSEDDLLDRYYESAVKHRANIVLRLPADNVCSEPCEFDRLVEYHIHADNDFSSNICNFMGNGYPDGIGVEAISFSALEAAHAKIHTSHYREHVAASFYDYINDRMPDESPFSVGTINCPEEISRPDITLDVNTRQDYELMRDLYHSLYPQNPNFTIRDVIDWFDRRKEVGP